MALKSQAKIWHLWRFKAPLFLSADSLHKREGAVQVSQKEKEDSLIIQSFFLIGGNNNDMWFKLTLLAVVTIGLASAYEVTELTDSNFEAELERHDVALVMFYAPWSVANLIHF